MKKYKVYIAAPYTKPDPALNVRKAIEVADDLLGHGFIPYVPHLTHFWHIISPKPYEQWLELDNHFLPLCDFLLRLEGESEGADKEVALARELGIPVFYSLADFYEQQNSQKNQ